MSDRAGTLPYRVEVYPEPNGTGFTAVVPDLPGCLTSGETLEELWANVEDAKGDWLEEAAREGRPVPAPSQLQAAEYSGRFLVRMAKSLHRRLSLRARSENVSINMLVVQLISQGMGSWQEGGELRALFTSRLAGQELEARRSLVEHLAQDSGAYNWETAIEKR